MKKKMALRFPYIEIEDYRFFDFNTLSDYKASDRFYYIIHGAGNADPKAIMKAFYFIR